MALNALLSSLIKYIISHFHAVSDAKLLPIMKRYALLRSIWGI